MKGSLVAVALAAAVLVPVGGAAAASRPAPALTNPFEFQPSDSAFDIHKKGQPGFQHGGEEGHLPPVNRNTELISKLRLVNEPGRIADVSALNGYAYLGAYSEPVCQTGGTYVVDIRDPAAPKRVGFIPSHTDSFVSEGVQAIHVDTPKFNGDLLFQNNESCDKNGVGGMSIFDVSDPLRPKRLVEGAGDFTNPGASQRQVHQIHSVFAWDAGDRAYAILVDDEENLDVDIMDVTDPSRPRLIAETGQADPMFAAAVAKAGNANGDTYFHHDLWVRKFGERWIAMLSYWDLGWVKLDVTEPAKPVFVKDSDYAAEDPEFPGVRPPEGNAHQGDWNRSGGYFVGTDEDFSPYRLSEFLVDGLGQRPAGEFGFTRPIAQLPDKRLNGPTVYGGYGCNDDLADIPPPSVLGALADGEESIVVFSRGPVQDPNHPHDACRFDEKIANAAAAGYDAAIIANHHVGSGAGASPDAVFCGSGAPRDIRAVCIGHKTLHEMFGRTPDYTVPYPTGDPGDKGPNAGDPGPRVSATPQFDGWGYVHLLDADTLAELDTYAVEDTKLEANAFGKGALSVHETEADPNRDDLMYYSYYAAGFRATRITADKKLEEVAAFIDQGGNDFWGLIPLDDTRPGRAGKTMVLLSDRDFGLYIVEYTGG